MTARNALPRMHCRECGRRVPVVVPAGGAGETYRQHSATVGGGTPCSNSRQPVPVVVATVPRPSRYRDLSFWCGPRTWENAGL